LFSVVKGGAALQVVRYVVAAPFLVAFDALQQLDGVGDGGPAHAFGGQIVRVAALVGTSDWFINSDNSLAMDTLAVSQAALKAAAASGLTDIFTCL
jgi:hypothetical protein